MNEVKRVPGSDLMQRKSPDGASADAAEVKSAIMFKGIRDLCVTAGGWVLQVVNNSAIQIQAKHEAVTLGRRLHE